MDEIMKSLPRTKSEFLRQYSQLAQIPELQGFLAERDPLPLIRQKVRAAWLAIDRQSTDHEEQRKFTLYSDFLAITTYALPLLSEILALGIEPLKAWVALSVWHHAHLFFMPDDPNRNLVAQYLTVMMGDKEVTLEGERIRLSSNDDDEALLPEAFSQLLVDHAERFPDGHQSPDWETWEWLQTWKPANSSACAIVAEDDR